MIKKFENFFGGTHLGSDQAGFNSSEIRKTNLNPDDINPIDLKINSLKEEICSDILDKNLDMESLRKIKNLLSSL